MQNVVFLMTRFISFSSQKCGLAVSEKNFNSVYCPCLIKVTLFDAINNSWIHCYFKIYSMQYELYQHKICAFHINSEKSKAHSLVCSDAFYSRVLQVESKYTL